MRKFKNALDIFALAVLSSLRLEEEEKKGKTKNKKKQKKNKKKKKKKWRLFIRVPYKRKHDFKI